MKKLINDSRDVVTESLAGFFMAHSDIVRPLGSGDIVVRAGEKEPGKVGILSGGGSGHEPLHSGFVGFGMLDAAIVGPIFTSPTPIPILAATKHIDSGSGVLYLVKNYTGDVLNFETAADLAGTEGIDVRMVVIDDDVAVEDSIFTAGRRGVAGALLIEKIVGAAAQRGDDLDSLEKLANALTTNVRSIGVALTPPTVPYSAEPSFTLADDEIEFGVGIHGEPGRHRLPYEPVDALVDRMLEALSDAKPAEIGDTVLVFVNGMGGTPPIELYVAYRRAHEAILKKGFRIDRQLVGSFVTSLEMQGFSITLLTLDDELTVLWDSPVHAAALRWGR